MYDACVICSIAAVAEYSGTMCPATRISRLPESTCAGEVTRRKNEKLTDIDIEKHPFSPPLSPCSPLWVAAVSQFSHVLRQAVSGITFFMAAEMIRTSKCIGVITGLKVAAIWLELLNAATLSQFGHAPGRQVVRHGLLHGSLHHQGQIVQANLQKRAACEDGPGAAA